jgi:hypothetical protein
LGSITAGVLLWIQYVHALEAGVNSKKPGTEDYGDRGEENARR